VWWPCSSILWCITACDGLGAHACNWRSCLVVGSDIPQTLLHWGSLLLGNDELFFFWGKALDWYRLAGLLFGSLASMRGHFRCSMASSRIKTLLTVHWLP
jgi:hypothetical protein